MTLAGIPSDLRRELDTRAAVCGVVGLGFVGSETVHSLLDSGFVVRGYDLNPEAVSAARARFGESLVADVSPGVLAPCRVVLVAVRIRAGAGDSVDTAPVRDVARALAGELAPGSLVIIVSTVPPGTTRSLQPILGEGIHLAHCPERIDANNAKFNVRNTPRLVGGLEATAGDLATAFCETICDRVVRVSAPEVSELAKLLENSYRGVALALIGEVTEICHGHGVAASEVCDAAATKPFGYQAFFPGLRPGGHCIGNDLSMLRASGVGVETSPRLLDAVLQVTDGMAEVAASRLEGFGGPDSLRGARVLLVGVGYKPGVGDTTETPAADLVRTLIRRGAMVEFVDHLVDEFRVDGEEIPRRNEESLPPGSFQAAFLVSGDASIDPQRLRKAVSGVVLDVGGGRIMKGPMLGVERL